MLLVCTTFIFHLAIKLEFEFEFQMSPNANDAYALLIMMTWHLLTGDYCCITWGCYNSPLLTRILVPKIKRGAETERGILHEDDPRVPKWPHPQNDSTTVPSGT